MYFINIIFVFILIAGCGPAKRKRAVRNDNTLGTPVCVRIDGYNGNVMEPFLSRDGDTLLFNNLNGAPENTNLHWALRVNDTLFKYRGEISGINTTALEGVATLDKNGNLFFVSDRSYKESLSTLYQCSFSDGKATDVHIVPDISRHEPGWVNFDIEVNATGSTIYFTDARFNSSGVPQTADLVIAHKTSNGFKRDDRSEEIMKNINTDGLEYAACISPNELELYFTRINTPLTAQSEPEVFVARRNKLNDKFGEPLKISNITGFAEAPTISPNGKILYYHKKEGNKFVLYMIKKKIIAN